VKALFDVTGKDWTQVVEVRARARCERIPHAAYGAFSPSCRRPSDAFKPLAIPRTTLLKPRRSLPTASLSRTTLSWWSSGNPRPNERPNAQSAWCAGLDRLCLGTIPQSLALRPSTIRIGRTIVDQRLGLIRTRTATLPTEMTRMSPATLAECESVMMLNLLHRLHYSSIQNRCRGVSVLTITLIK
jgi:hypothetical protein